MDYKYYNGTLYENKKKKVILVTKQNIFMKIKLISSNN